MCTGNSKRWWLCLIILALLLIFGILIPLMINQSYKSNIGYQTLWGPADVLSYYGSFLGAFGTIFLGYVAWTQNKRLLKIEENSFIANNACIGFMRSIVFSDVNQKACNLEAHVEQIVSALPDDTRIDNYGSLTLKVEMKIEDNVAALVRIKTLNLIVSRNGLAYQNTLECHGIEKSFSRVAILPGGIKFNITMIVNPEEKKHFLELVDNQHSKILVDLDFTLLTDKYVSTDLKCKSSLSSKNYSDKEGIYNEFRIDSDESTLCFWYGNEMLDRKSIKIK